MQVSRNDIGPAACAITAALLAAAAGSASAGITSWTNAAGGNWSDAANWSAGVPSSLATTAEISLAGAYTVTANISPVMGGLLLTNPDATVGILNGLGFTVASDSATDVQLVNNASILVNANQGISFTHLVVGDADTAAWIGPEPGQTGEIVLNVGPGNGDLTDATLTINAGTHAADHTIRGKGRIAGAFVNEGVLLADRPGDELRIVGDVTQQAGGLVHATAGGFVGIGENGVLRAGTLITDTNGKIRFQAGTGTLAGGAHNLGEIEVANAQAMVIGDGGITNDGSITLNSNLGVSLTQIVVNTADPILGTGRIDLNVFDGNGDLTDATLTTGAVTATNGPDHAITGKGRVSGSWINEGSIEADRDGQELRIQAAVVQTATGTIGATNNGVLGIADGGRVSGGTVVTATGGSVQATGGVGFVDGGLVNLGAMGVRNGQALHIDTGGIVNNGVITVNSNSGVSITDLTFIADTTISGTGAVDLNVFDSNGDYSDARLITAAGITGTIGPDQSVTGKGRVTGAFVNNGTINANRSDQDIRLSGVIDQGPSGVIKGTKSGFAAPEGVAITGGFFDSDATGAVLVQAGTNSISGVTSLNNAGIRNGAAMSLLGGGLTNHGLFSINSNQGTSWTIFTIAEDATIDGTGRIDLNVFDANGDYLDARLETAEGITATNGALHTISGKGRVLGTWINNGTMTGDRAGQDLRLVGDFDQSAGGTIRGDNGGFAVLFQANVTGGTFDSGTGGTVLVDIAPNSVSAVTNLGDMGLRNGASLNIRSGGLVNDGTLVVNTAGGNSWTIIAIDEDATISGTGVIDLNINDGNADFLDARINVADGVVATHAEPHTIAGKGRVTGTWINHGTFRADRPAQELQILDADVSQSATGIMRGDDADIAMTNATVTGGVFDSSGVGSVQFAGGNSQLAGVHSLGSAGVRSGANLDLLAPGFTNDGTFTVNSNQGLSWTIVTATGEVLIDGDGVTRLGLAPGNADFNDCRLRAAEGFTLTLGPAQTLSGRGWLIGDIVLQGPVTPGSDDEIAIDTINASAIGASGSITFAPTTEYRVQASAEEVNDRINAGVPVHVAGTLRFTPIDGFEPPRPTRYTIATATEVTGAFDTLIYEGTLPEGAVFRVVYEDTEVIAAVTCKSDIAAPIGVLDLSDITVFTSLFLAQSPLVDLAEPFGVLDLSDISAFIVDFLAGCGP